MKEILTQISLILDSNAKVIETRYVEGNNKATKDIKIIDYRLNTIKRLIASVPNRNDDFYKSIIIIIANHLNRLFGSDRRIRKDFINENGQLENAYFYGDSAEYHLSKADHELAIKLFDFVCFLLNKRKNIILDKNTLIKLLNRSPEESTISVELHYNYRLLDFKKLAKIIIENEMFKKMGLSLNDIYDILIETCQINNEDIFTTFISPSDFQQDHKKIDDFVVKCNTKIFVETTDIIIKRLDSNYDRLSLIKGKANSKNYIEHTIMSLLSNHCSDNVYQLIHELLTDPELNIDYGCYMSDYFGQSNLKSELAHKGNITLIRDLLSNPNNIESVYWHGDSRVKIEWLYALVGEYDKALEIFKSSYHFETDYNEDFYDYYKNNGICEFETTGKTTGDWSYKDTIIELLHNFAKSFDEEDINQSERLRIIEDVLSKAVYLNLAALMQIGNMLSEENLNIVITKLLERKGNGTIKFIITEDSPRPGMFERYIIRNASDEEFQGVIESITMGKTKKLALIPNKDI